MRADALLQVGFASWSSREPQFVCHPCGVLFGLLDELPEWRDHIAAVGERDGQHSALLLPGRAHVCGVLERSFVAGEGIAVERGSEGGVSLAQRRYRLANS